MYEITDEMYLFCKKNGLTPVWIDTDDGIWFWAGVHAEKEIKLLPPNPPEHLEERLCGYQIVLTDDSAYCLEKSDDLPFNQFEKFLLTPYMRQTAEYMLSTYEIYDLYDI